MKPLNRLFALLLIMVVLMSCLGEENLPELNEMPTLTALIEAAVTQTSKPTVIPTLTLTTRTVIPVATKNDIRPLVTPTIEHLQVLESNDEMITFWYQLSPDLEPLLARFIERFNDSNLEGITIAGVTLRAERNIYADLLQARLEGNQPHLLMSSEYAPTTKQIEVGLADFVLYFEDERFGLSDEERQPLYHFPASRSLEVIYYNADLLQQLGFESPPATWEGLQEMACAARDAGYIGYQFRAEAHHLMGMIFSRGETLITDNHNAYKLDSAAAIESMSFLQELFAQGCALLVHSTEMQSQTFGSGQLLFAVDSSAGLASYQRAVAEGYGGTWSVAPFPHTTTEPVLISSAASFSIPKSTPQQELAAWLFVKWYTDSQQQAEWAQLSNHFPVSQSATPLLSEYFAQNPSYKEAFDLLSYSKSEPNITGHHLLHGLLAEVMIEIIKGADVQQILIDLNEETNAILNLN
jgi:ABC-type glycerol-3-phosphate transport system substrate-binding protein